MNHSFEIDSFNEGLSVSVSLLSSSEIEFELVGVDPSLANALRRISIAEVPTVAIESVYIWNNTSIVQDEVLAQRLGLIPLLIDPNLVELKATTEEAPTDLNTVVFNLVAKCERRKDVKKGETNPDLIWTGSRVLSDALSFEPKGAQAELFKQLTPQPAVKDILIAKMRGGQEIVAELHCNKGTGKEHAKWSPVGKRQTRPPRTSLPLAHPRHSARSDGLLPATTDHHHHPAHPSITPLKVPGLLPPGRDRHLLGPDCRRQRPQGHRQPRGAQAQRVPGQGRARQGQGSLLV